MKEARFLAATRLIREARLRRAEERVGRSHAAYMEAQCRIAEAVDAIEDHRHRTAAAERMAMEAMLGRTLRAAAILDLENNHVAAQLQTERLAKAKAEADQHAHVRWTELEVAKTKLHRARLALDKIDALAAEMSVRGAMWEAALAELAAEEDYKPAMRLASSC